MENEYWLFKVNIQTMNEILHQLVNTVLVTTKPRPYHWIGTYIPSTNCQGSVHHNRFMAYACSVCTVYVYNLFLIDVKKLVIWLLDIRILYIYIYHTYYERLCTIFMSRLWSSMPKHVCRSESESMLILVTSLLETLDIFWEFQDPKMEEPYHIRPYFVGIFP